MMINPATSAIGDIRALARIDNIETV